MLLVACDPGDAPALWATRRLRRLGVAPLEAVSADALARPHSVEHRLGAGQPSVRIELADGRRIESGEVTGILNRLTHVPAESLGDGAERDRSYAAQEISALLLSWLSAMPCPVLNRPSPDGLAGPLLDSAQWLVLATQAGLSTRPLRVRSTGTAAEAAESPVGPIEEFVVACGALCGGSLPDGAAAACRRLAELSGADLLGIGLRQGSDGEWEFAGATPLPDLRIGGDELIERLAEALADGAAR